MPSGVYVRKPFSEDQKRNMGLAHVGKVSALRGRKRPPFSEEHKKNMSLARLKILPSLFTKETRQRMSEAKLGKKRQPHSNETKKKMRLSTIKYIREHHDGMIYPRRGTNEAQILDNQELIDGCKIIRQYYIKSLGYFVDGYCPETNTVYEVYEPHHDKLIERDSRRESEIRSFLNCRFTILRDSHV